MPQIIRDRPISIHALREEGDVCRYSPSHSHPYFYPRPPRGGRLVAIEPKDSGRAISIHALREEGDQLIYRGATQVALFLSTPSARRATYIDAHLDDEVQFLSTPSARRATQGHSLLAKSKQISIHALREEGDSPFLARRSTSEYFYPRPPRGGRRQARSGHQVAQDISIHALREEGDAAGGCSECAQKNFYPRPPRGGRQ